MLDTQTAEDFIQLIGQTCLLTSEDGLSLELLVESVKEEPRFKMPQSARMPFSVLFKGPMEPYVMSGLFTMECPSGLLVPGVCINRIMPPVRFGQDSACYQMVFN